MKKTVARKSTARISRAEQMKDDDAFMSCFYDPALDEGEVDELDANPVTGMQDEIGLIRILMRRVSMLAKGVDSLDEAITALRAVGSASTQLASLLRSQKALDEDSGRAADTLSRALTEVMREFNLS